MRPLDGITVVSLEHAVAAPFATRQLADMGARVIKIERPEVGDFARNYDDRVKGLASHFVWANRSKESLTLDVKHSKSKDILTKLVSKADILVQNLAPGAAERLGLSHQNLKIANPGLITCNISGYGSDGHIRTAKPMICWFNPKRVFFRLPELRMILQKQVYRSQILRQECMHIRIFSQH